MPSQRLVLVPQAFRFTERRWLRGAEGIGFHQLLLAAGKPLFDVIRWIGVGTEFERLFVVVDGGGEIVLARLVEHTQLEVRQGRARIVLDGALEGLDGGLVIQGGELLPGGDVMAVLLFIRLVFGGPGAPAPAEAEQYRPSTAQHTRQHAARN